MHLFYETTSIYFRSVCTYIHDLKKTSINADFVQLKKKSGHTAYVISHGLGNANRQTVKNTLSLMHQRNMQETLG